MSKVAYARSLVLVGVALVLGLLRPLAGASETQDRRVASGPSWPEPGLATDTTSSIMEADLDVVALGPGQTIRGDTVLLSIQIRNRGRGPSSGVLVSAALPKGVAIVGPGSEISYRDGVAFWPPLATLAPGNSESLTLQLTFEEAGEFMSLVSAIGQTPEATFANNATRIVTEVRGPKDILPDPNSTAQDGSGIQVDEKTSTIDHTEEPTILNGLADRPLLGIPLASQVVRRGIGSSTGAGIDDDLPSLTLRPFTASPRDAISVTPEEVNPSGYPTRPILIDVEKIGPDTVRVSEPITYTIRVENTGSEAARYVELRDELPDGVTFLSATNGGTLNGDIVTWPTIPMLAGGASRTDTLRVRAPPEPNTLTNLALGEATNAPPDTSIWVTIVEDQPPPPPPEPILIDVLKTGPEVANTNDTITYTISVANLGELAAENVVLSDTLPAGVTFLRATRGGEVNTDSTVVTWPTIPMLAGGASHTDTLRVRAPPEPNTLTNLALGEATNAPPDTSIWVTIVEDQPPPPPPEPILIDVEVTKGAPATVTRGEEITYSIIATNLGDQPARMVHVVDTLPRQVHFVRASDGATERDGVISWPPVDVLPPGERLTYTVIVRSSSVGIVRNRVRVSTNPEDSNPSNNHDETITRVEDPFPEEGIIIGRVFSDCGCDPDRQSEGELGIPGVRIFLQDGTSAVTDSEGDYHFLGLRPRLWVVKVDATTMPVAARMIPLTNSHGNDGSSVFVDLKASELARADFADGFGGLEVTREIESRRSLSDIERIGSDDAGRASQALNGGSRHSLFVPLLSDELPSDPDAGGGRLSEDTLPAPPRPGRSLLAAGLLEARIDLRSLADGDLGLGIQRDRFEDELRSFQTEDGDGQFTAGARAAAFMKGTLQNGYELTLRIDSEEDDRSRLFRDIRPDELYPVYGDASIREFDAQSKGRLFGRIRSGASYLSLGDFNTGLGAYGQTGARALGQYSRTLNGVLEHFENDRVALNGFVSRDRFSQAVDEIRGDGISGPYQLSQIDGLINSERVELITRDRNQPAVILRNESMDRFTDYTIEPFSGRIIFKRPIPSVDPELNPVFIRVTYEVEGGANRFWIVGADAQFRPWKQLELGGGIVRDENPASRFDLASLNATLGLGSATLLFGEFARTDGASTNLGDASRFGLRHASKRFDASLLFLETDASFANPSAAFRKGRRELSLRVAARLDSQTRVFGELLRTENRILGGIREGGRLGLNRDFNSWMSGQLAYRYADETDPPATEPPVEGSTAGPEADAPVRVNTVAATLTARPPGFADISLTAEFEQDVSREEQRRAWIGSDYTIAKRARLFARHEFITSFTGPYGLNPEAEQNSTALGVSADYRSGQSVFTEYRVRDALGGREGQAAIGLRNTWSVKDGIRVSTSFERLSPVDGGGVKTTALTGGVEFTGNPVWVGSARAEYWGRNGSDQIFGSLAYALKINPDFTLLANTVFSTSLDAERSFERTRVGIAWRQTGRNRWNALTRYEHRYDDDPNAPDLETRRGAHIFWTHVNYLPVPDLVLRAHWASKLASGERDRVDFSDNAHLLGLRGTIDVTERVDFGVTGRTMFSDGYDSSQFGFGGEVGLRVRDNLRLATGYNLFGFRDEGFSSEDNSDHGFYVHFGFKFDEALFGLRAAQARQPDKEDRLRCLCHCPEDPCPTVIVEKRGPRSVYTGDEIRYELQIINPGTTSLGRVVLTDTMREPAAVLDASNGAIVSADGLVVTWPAIHTLPAGASRTETMTVRAPTEAGGLTNMATVRAADALPDTSVWTVTVDNPPTSVDSTTIQVTKIGPDTVRVRQSFAYDIHLENTGNETARDLVLSDALDVLPEGSVILSATNGGTISGDSLAVIWPTIPAFPADSSRTDTVWVLAPPGPGRLLNVATLTARNANVDSGTARTEVVYPRLIVEPAGPNEACRGQPIPYRIRVFHESELSERVIVSVALGTGLTVRSHTGAQASDSERVVDSVVGADSVVEFALSLEGEREGSFEVVVHAFGPSLEPTQVRETIAIGPPCAAPAIEMEKRRIGSEPVSPNDSVHYAIQITNRGGSRVEGIQLSDLLPSDAPCVRATGSPSLDGSILSWRPFALEALDVRTDTVVIQAPQNPGSFVNRAVVGSDTSSVTSVVSDSASPPDSTSRPDSASPPKPTDCPVCRTCPCPCSGGPGWLAWWALLLLILASTIVTHYMLRIRVRSRGSEQITLHTDEGR